MGRRRPLAAVILVAVAVLLALSWFGWGREGLTPVKPVTDATESINELYAFIGFWAALVFLAVMIPLALIIARYRERGLPREAEGPQVRGNTRLEILWTIVPLLIVLLISGVSLYKAVDIVDPARAGEGSDERAVEVTVEGRQFYWRYIYDNGVVAINRLRVPVDRLVDLTITAPNHDVQHSFWAPALQGKQDAIPDVRNHIKFRARETGEYDGRCTELCGIQHSVMNFTVEVMPRDEFDRWLEQASTAQNARSSDLGRDLWEGVCTTCHFSAPEYAPNIIGNPLLGDPEGITRIVQNGQGRMPAVGKGWSENEMAALIRYLRTLAPQDEEGDEDDGS